jgi:hypothetical protein
MKRTARPFLAATTVVLIALTLTAVASAPADQVPATLSFFSGGRGAHASWLTTTDQPPGDTGNMGIGLVTTNQNSSYLHGYAGILVRHVKGIPATAFPDPWFWNKTPQTLGFALPAPRLVVEFQTEGGQFVGYAALRQNVRWPGWIKVDDRTNFPKAAWELSGGPCGFLYNIRWSTVQKCFDRDTVLSVFIVADPDGIHHLIDGVTVAGTTFSSASDNAKGNNTPAGPKATTDPKLLPVVLPAVLS